MSEQAVAGRLAKSVAQVVEASSAESKARLKSAVAANFNAVWCFLRRLGLSPADADDAAQDVMMVAAQKLPAIVPGLERSFMFGTAYRIASRVRKAAVRRMGAGDDELCQEPDPSPDPEVLSDQRRARDMLDQVLDTLPLDLRAVFVLTEIDELPASQIALLLELPAGTVASRLRRAREKFDATLHRILAGRKFSGGAS